MIRDEKRDEKEKRREDRKKNDVKTHERSITHTIRRNLGRRHKTSRLKNKIEFPSNIQTRSDSLSLSLSFHSYYTELGDEVSEYSKEMEVRER
jgi:hypothetical protein